MPLTGEAKTAYMREYMRRKRAGLPAAQHRAPADKPKPRARTGTSITDQTDVFELAKLLSGKLTNLRAEEQLAMFRTLGDELGFADLPGALEGRPNRMQRVKTRDEFIERTKKIVKALKVEGKASMATMSPPNVAILAGQLEQLLEQLCNVWIAPSASERERVRMK